MKIKGNILGIAGALAALVLLIGSFTFLSACKSEGEMHMACHWAQNAVTLIAAVIAAQELIRIFIPNRQIKTGLAIGVFLLSIALIILPENVISLCMMETMRCHTVFRPAVIVISSILAVISGADALIGIIKNGVKNER